MSCLCAIHACVKFSPILAQRQLLGAGKHEGGGKKGILLKRWKTGKQVKKSGGCLKSERLKEEERQEGCRGLRHVLLQPLCWLSDWGGSR